MGSIAINGTGTRGIRMNVLVTGANGYLGQGIVQTLLDNGIGVTAADIATDRVDARAKRVDCDLFALNDPFAYLGEPDVVLHLAWRDGFVHNAPSHIDQLSAHCGFIRRLAEAGAKRIAVMGTMHEVGFFEGSIDETTPCAPMNCYGIAKNALRGYVEWLHTATPFAYQWLRGYYIVGHSEYGRSIFSKITAAVRAGQTEFPFTMGLNQYDFIDYPDFCHQVAAAVMQDKVDGIINICSGRPEKLSDRVERFIRENGYSIKLRYGAFPDRPYDAKAVWGSDQKIAAILQTSPIQKTLL